MGRQDHWRRNEKSTIRQLVYETFAEYNLFVRVDVAESSKNMRSAAAPTSFTKSTHVLYPVNTLLSIWSWLSATHAHNIPNEVGLKRGIRLSPLIDTDPCLYRNGCYYYQYSYRANDVEVLA